MRCKTSPACSTAEGRPFAAPAGPPSGPLAREMRAMDPVEPKRQLVEQLAEEFIERYRRGERPPLSEYTDRHPEHAAEIRDLFPALVMMEQIAPDSETARPAPAPAA